MTPAERTAVEVEGRRLSLSNLDKVLYPSTGLVKAQVIDYYRRIAPVLLPHVQGRPITLKRYPDGVTGEFFYEKNCPSHRPKWVRTVPIESRSGRGRGRAGTIEFCVVDDLPSLVWVANLAALELHPYLHRGARPTRPTCVVFDLDPGEPAGLLDAARVALRLRRFFEQLDLVSVSKTSGGKGMQVYVPLNGEISYEQTTPFARAVAQLLERRDRDHVVANMRKDLRRGKVLVDWSQNNAHKTTVGVYSLRARSRPTVSTPLRWHEIEEAVDRRDPDRLVFEAADVLDRVDEHGDLFADVDEVQQELPEVG